MSRLITGIIGIVLSGLCRLHGGLGEGAPLIVIVVSSSR